MSRLRSALGFIQSIPRLNGSKGPFAMMKLYTMGGGTVILDFLHEFLLSKLVARPATSAGTPSQAAWPPSPLPPPP